MPIFFDVAEPLTKHLCKNVDASDSCAGGILFQEEYEGIDHPVCCFPKKFNKYQINYFTIKKNVLPQCFSTEL